jgi:hypothetical protein
MATKGTRCLARTAATPHRRPYETMNTAEATATMNTPETVKKEVLHLLVSQSAAPRLACKDGADDGARCSRPSASAWPSLSQPGRQRKQP